MCIHLLSKRIDKVYDKVYDKGFEAQQCQNRRGLIRIRLDDAYHPTCVPEAVWPNGDGSGGAAHSRPITQPPAQGTVGRQIPRLTDILHPREVHVSIRPAPAPARHHPLFNPGRSKVRGIRSIPLFLCIAALFALMAAGVGAAEDEPKVEETIVTAESTVSFDHATEKALRKAVREKAGVALTGMTKVRDFELIRDSIYSRARGYVRRHKVLNKKRGLQDTFIVRIHAEVSTGQITDDALAIHSLIEQQVRPRFEIIVESIGGDVEGNPELWVRTALQKSFEDTHFRVVDAETYLESLRRRQKRARLNGRHRKAEFLGLQMGSVYRVKVEGTGRNWEQKAFGVNITNYKVQLAPRVVQFDTGDILSVDDAAAIAQDKGNLGTVGWRDACNSAVQQVYPSLRDGILKHWTKWLDIGRPLMVQVYGVPFKTVENLRDSIRAMETVKGARIVEAPAGGIANIRVIGRVKAPDIAARIEDWTDGKLLGSTDGPSQVSANPPPEKRAPRPPAGGQDKSPAGSEQGSTGGSPDSGSPAPAGQPAPDWAGGFEARSSGPSGSAKLDAGGLPDYVLPAAIVGGGLLLGILGAALILRR